MANITLWSHNEARTFFDSTLSEITKEIQSKSPDYILNVNESKWEEYFVDKYEMFPLTIYLDKAVQNFVGKEKKYEEHYERRFQYEVHRFEIHVPFTGSPQLFMYRPSEYSYTLDMRTFEVRIPNDVNGEITGFIAIRDQDATAFQIEKNKFIAALQNNIPNINKEVKKYNERIIPHFHAVLKAERTKITEEKGFFESIGITVNEGTKSIFEVPVIKKKKIPEPIVDSKKPKKFVQVPSLPDELYDDLLKVIYTATHELKKA